MSTDPITTSVIFPAAHAGLRLTGPRARPVIQVTGYGIEADLSIEQTDAVIRSLTFALAKARAIEEL